MRAKTATLAAVMGLAVSVAIAEVGLAGAVRAYEIKLAVNTPKALIAVGTAELVGWTAAAFGIARGVAAAIVIG